MSDGCRIQWVRRSVEPPTVPARVRFWFLKPPRDVGEGNPLEDVHATVEPQTNALALHHSALGAHHPELQEWNTNMMIHSAFAHPADELKVKIEMILFLLA